VFAHISHETQPKLWTHQLFLPGDYPMESLEKQLKVNDFAILVASPDDQLLKRGQSSTAMRDNLLLEFGLFAGALGRKRVFFLCPSTPSIELPSNLLGVVMATYDGTRVSSGADEIAAAVQVPCQQIRSVIRDQWESICDNRRQVTERIRASERGKAVESLYGAVVRFRDAVMELDGRIDPADLKAAILHVYQQHPVLGARQGMSWFWGRPVWRAPQEADVIEAQARAAYQYDDLRERDDAQSVVDDLCQQRYVAEWDLQRGPQMRFEHYDLPNDKTRLVIRWPHMLMDAEGAMWMLAQIDARSPGANTEPCDGLHGADDVRKQGHDVLIAQTRCRRCFQTRRRRMEAALGRQHHPQ